MVQKDATGHTFLEMKRKVEQERALVTFSESHDLAVPKPHTLGFPVNMNQYSLLA